jgi:hypothetical protein
MSGREAPTVGIPHSGALPGKPPSFSPQSGLPGGMIWGDRQLFGDGDPMFSLYTLQETIPRQVGPEDGQMDNQRAPKGKSGI